MKEERRVRQMRRNIKEKMRNRRIGARIIINNHKDKIIIRIK